MKTDEYIGPIKFGDEKLIALLKRNKIKDLERTKITIDCNMLIKLGIEKSAALNLIERLINLKNK
jgi:hypothetical protein